MSVSIVIPARNEAVSLARLLESINKLQGISETIVVDDGSSDDTASIAANSGAKVLRNPRRVGNGASIKRGARTATGDVIVFMDADGQHDPGDIPKLLERYNQGYDMVVGARLPESHASLGRRLANSAYNLLSSYITGYRIKDLTSGFRVVDAEKFREFLYLLPNGFSYPTTITMAFLRAGFLVTFEEIHAGKREGKSHIRLFRDGTRFLLIIFKIGTLYSPLKLFAPLAAIFFCAGIGWYAYTYATTARFTNMSALLITGSFLTFMMGLISEQITALVFKDTGRTSD